MEGDLFTPDTTEFTLEFQSTPSAWRETSKQCPEAPPAGYFNPLPPHGGRQRNDFSDIYHSHISIHSLRMEGDQGNSADYRGIMEFQSTPSAWRET